MRTALILLCVSLLAGCASSGGYSGGSWPIAASGSSRTYESPIARVKPAFVSSLAQWGMRVTAIETRGGNEVVKARNANQSVEIEFERLGAASTRVRAAMRTNAGYDESATSKFLQQAGRLIPAS
jgi:hypothetical protein